MTRNVQQRGVLTGKQLGRQVNSYCTLTLCAAILFSAAVFGAHTPSSVPQLAVRYPKNHQLAHPITDYLVSEKLDGVRGVWTGTQLLTKQGLVIDVPPWFTKGWPARPLDGELWSQRNNFEHISACVRRQHPARDKACWQSLKFMVFDMPQVNIPFEQRYQQFSDLIARLSLPTLTFIKQQAVASSQQLRSRLEQLVKDNGEGLMLHYKNGQYKAGRNNDLIKLKMHQDAEAIVVDHLSGKGKLQGKLGSVLVKTLISEDFPEPITFKVGSGFSDQQRLMPPKIGDIITFKYFGKTRHGTPRFASFLRVRYSKHSPP